MVEAVPITAQVPAVTASWPSTSRDLFGIDIAGAVARPEAPAVGAGAEPLAAIAPGHHRPGDQRDGRPIGGDRAHQLRRHRLVAAAHQHHRVHRLGADHLLGVDRHQVAVFEAGRRQKDLAERDGRKFERQRAGSEHAAFHRRQQFGKMTVTIVEVRRRIGDADHRLVQQRARIAHRLRERAPQVAREIAIAVIGETVVQSDNVFCHCSIISRLLSAGLRRSRKRTDFERHCH